MWKLKQKLEEVAHLSSGGSVELSQHEAELLLEAIKIVEAIQNIAGTHGAGK